MGLLRGYTRSLDYGVHRQLSKAMVLFRVRTLILAATI